MELVTQAVGIRTRVVIAKTALLEAIEDLEKVPLRVPPAEHSESGVALTLPTAVQGTLSPAIIPRLTGH